MRVVSQLRNILDAENGKLKIYLKYVLLSRTTNLNMLDRQQTMLDINKLMQQARALGLVLNGIELCRFPRKGLGIIARKNFEV